MKRRSLPVAAAFATTAALLLTACGGGDDGTKANDKIAGADDGVSASATPITGASDEPRRPDISLPDDVKDEFDGWATGDATKDAVLADASRAQTAMNDAIIKGTPDTPGMAFYYKGKALRSSTQWVQKWLDAGITYTGTTRYYHQKVEIFDDKSAGVSYCADETKAYNKDRKTGKVDRTAAGSDAFVPYNTRLERNGRGVWQTADGTSVRGSKTCAR